MALMVLFLHKNSQFKSPGTADKTIKERFRSQNQPIFPSDS